MDNTNENVNTEYKQIPDEELLSVASEKLEKFAEAFEELAK